MKKRKFEIFAVPKKLAEEKAEEVISDTDEESGSDNEQIIPETEVQTPRLTAEEIPSDDDKEPGKEAIYKLKRSDAIGNAAGLFDWFTQSSQELESKSQNTTTAAPVLNPPPHTLGVL